MSLVQKLRSLGLQQVRSCPLSANRILPSLLGRRDIPVKFPSLWIGWRCLFPGGVIQSRIALPLVIVLAPPIAMAIRILLFLWMASWSSWSMSHLKAAQERLRLKGNRILVLAALQQWQLINMFLEQMSALCLLGKERQVGALSSSWGKALVSPLSGPIVLHNRPMVVLLVLLLVRHSLRIVGILPIYGTLTVELPRRMIMAPGRIVVIVVTRRPRPLGTVRAAWLQFLSLHCLGSLVKTMVILVLVVVVMVVRLSVGLMALLLAWQFRVQVILGVRLSV